MNSFDNYDPDLELKIRRAITPRQNLALILLPWLCFSAALCLSLLHHTDFNFAWLFGGVIAFVCTLFTAFGCATGTGVTTAVGLLSVGAVALALPIGSAIQVEYMEDYWHLTGGATYRDVDPKLPSAAFLDASIVEFTEDAEVHVQHGVGYMNAGRVYCVAPISSANFRAPRPTFWAVGQDCCDSRGKFFCGPSQEPPVQLAGLTTPDETGFYAKAVRMAGSVYDFESPSANELLFMEWTGNAKGFVDTLFWSAAVMVAAASCLHLLVSVGSSVLVKRQLTRNLRHVPD